MDPLARYTAPTTYWHALDDGRVQCDLCPRFCKLREGQRGMCFVRARQDNQIVLTTYGRSSGFCIDPIEKKPLNHFLPGTSVLSFGTAGCNLACDFCFHPDTPVATVNGIRRIADLFEGCETRDVLHEGWVAFPDDLEVFTRVAKPARVAKVFARPYSGELLSIKAACCPPVLATPNHGFFAVHRSSPETVIKIAAGELTAEHFLVVPKRQPGAGSRIDVAELLASAESAVHAPRLRRVPRAELVAALSAELTSQEMGATLGYHPAYVRKLRGELARGVLAVEQPRPVRLRVDSGRIRFLGEKGKGLPEFLDVTMELAWLLGFYCAEGSVHVSPGRPNSCRLIFSCGPHEQRLVDRTAQLLAQVFQAGTTIVPRRTTITVECGSTSTARLFEALCGRGARNKRVPVVITQSPEPVVRAFLEGYFAGDGYVSSTHVVGNTVSRELALGLYELGLHLDLLPTFFVHRPAPTKMIEGREVSQLTTFIVKFKRDRFEPDGSTGVERRRWRDAGDTFLVPVRCIERVPYSGMVYNLEVDDADHSYLAPFLAVSNCQNWDISKSREVETLASEASPDAIARAAAAHGCRSVAFTYNDPVIFMEYAIDVAIACHERGIRTVAVTAGEICDAPRREFFKHMDAANVDLKAFTQDFYWKICKGDLQTVLDTLVYLKRETKVWFEITTLLIPGKNDSDEELRAMSAWIFKELGPDVPLHFSAFHPDYRMLDVPPTPPATLQRARRIAHDAGLRHVYVGNVHDEAGSSTYCPGCGAKVIGRDWYVLTQWQLDDGGACRKCGHSLPGRFEPKPGTWGARRQVVDMRAFG